MRSLKQNIGNEERRSGELQSSVKLLESRIDLLEKEKKDVSALLEKKSAELDAQRKQTEETEANLRDMIDIKHQLLVANDMLAAVKAQRQDLFAEVEKEKSERTELQQKLLISEETLRQFENDQQIDRKNIRALMAEIDVLKDELKKNSRDSRFLDEPEELDWLVPTRPDTPEEIARKKAEKKQADQQAQLDAVAQTVSILVIDKGRMKLKDAGLPDIVLENTPKYLRRSKVPVVKAKVGPKIMTLMCDAQVYPLIPVKKEVKATISGIYITAVKGVRGPLDVPEKKKGFFARLRNK